MSDAGEGPPWFVWFAFNAVIALALIFDLRSNQDEHARHPIRRAAMWSAFWIALAFFFAALISVVDSASSGATFLVGYLIEKSLSVDNLIVILLIFKHFRIRQTRQPRVLKLGILGAVVMRAVFIHAGIELLEKFEWMVYVFGALLLYAAVKMLQEEDDGDESDECNSQDSVIVRCLSKIVPYTTNATTTSFFLKSHRTKRLVATPMFAALLVIEASDVIFAIDSIPCILGLTQNRFLVYSSNMLAILGLRSLYVLLADALHRVKNLQTGLALVLAFVGTKMVLSDFVYVSETWSLLVIVAILAITVARGGVSGVGSSYLPTTMTGVVMRKRYEHSI
eukprot:g1779.t1